MSRTLTSVLIASDFQYLLNFIYLSQLLAARMYFNTFKVTPWFKVAPFYGIISRSKVNIKLLIANKFYYQKILNPSFVLHLPIFLSEPL